MIVAISFSAVLNNRSPHKDTLQTWTCRWMDRDVTIGRSAPDGFHSLCHETVSVPFDILVIYLLTRCPALCVLHHNPASCHSSRPFRARSLRGILQATSTEALSDRETAGPSIGLHQWQRTQHHVRGKVRQPQRVSQRLQVQRGSEVSCEP